MARKKSLFNEIMKEQLTAMDQVDSAVQKVINKVIKSVKKMPKTKGGTIVIIRSKKPTVSGKKKNLPRVIRKIRRNMKGYES